MLVVGSFFASSKDFLVSRWSLHHVETHAVGLTTLPAFPLVGGPDWFTRSQKSLQHEPIPLHALRSSLFPSCSSCTLKAQNFRSL